MAANYDGLTRNSWPGTWSPSSNHPIVLDAEIRGGLRYVSGEVGDRLTDITGQRLQIGMLAYLASTYVDGATFTGDNYYKYITLPGESRNPATGELPNATANWVVLNLSSGYTGSKGDIGYVGSKGDIGFTGSQGDIGFTGSQGYVGSQGVVGFTGSKGDLGFTGSKGYTGSEGYTGSQGVLGFTGSKGDLGFTGSVGYSGSQGDIGYTGSQGNLGYTGSKGTDGTSVKIVGSTSTYAALPGSYLGDIGDGFITSDNGHLNIWAGMTWSDVGNIVGPQGEIGYTGSIGYAGSRGIDGYTGSQGELGYVGSQGDVGYVGSQGERGNTGYTGSQGDTGYVGSQGNDGYVGSAGVDGYTGSFGYTGSSGYSGSQGNLGYTGSIGYTGSFGNTGYTGSSGYSGSQGNLGYTGSIGYTGSAAAGLVNTGSNVIVLQAGYSIIPETDGLQNLGSPTNRFGTTYLGANSVDIGGTVISIANSDGLLEFRLPNGSLQTIRAQGLMFSNGSIQTTKAPRMYTNADAQQGLTIDDLNPGDFYYDDGTESIFIMVDTGLGYNSLLDLTVRAQF
jgi:hypothetical protein